MIPRPEKPDDVSAPGLTWRPRNTLWVAYWIARSDIVKRGFAPKSSRVWPPSRVTTYAPPTADEWQAIGSLCEKLQAEMLAWVNERPGYDPLAVYSGTMASLIDVYLEDPDSPFQSIRFRTRHRYISILKALKAAIGKARIPDIDFRDFKRWHEGFCQPKRAGLPPRTSRGHSMMTFIRMTLSFGVMCKLAGCKAAKEVLDEMEFGGSKKRKEFLTAEMVVLVRREAHRRGWPSMALAQAMMFELMVRPKDIVGEEIPVSEPGLSDVVYRDMKWMHGATWREVSPELIFTHRLSKSLRGRNATLDPTAGKIEAYDLKAYPMIMEELRHHQRADGPMIVFEGTGRPWDAKYFAQKWREVARAVGIPDAYQNRDSRSGGITEGRRAGVPLEDLRHHAGHSMVSTTAGYDRSDVTDKNKVAQFRAKNRPTTA